MAKLTTVGLAKRSYGFLYYSPVGTTEGRLRAIGYRADNKVMALSDSLISFNVGVPTAVEDQPGPQRFVPNANVPNPFNPSTTIPFAIAEHGPVTVSIFDITGRRVRTLLDQLLPPGQYSVVWDGKNDRSEPSGSGIYFCEVTSAGARLTRKLSLIK